MPRRPIRTVLLSGVMLVAASVTGRAAVIDTPDLYLGPGEVLAGTDAVTGTAHVQGGTVDVGTPLGPLKVGGFDMSSGVVKFEVNGHSPSLVDHMDVLGPLIASGDTIEVTIAPASLLSMVSVSSY